MDSRTWGIFIRDTAYFIVIQWSTTLCFIESQWNMPYPVWNASRTGVRNPPITSRIWDRAIYVISTTLHRSLFYNLELKNLEGYITIYNSSIMWKFHEKKKVVFSLSCFLLKVHLSLEISIKDSAITLLFKHFKARFDLQLKQTSIFSRNLHNFKGKYLGRSVRVKSEGAV